MPADASLGKSRTLGGRPQSECARVRVPHWAQRPRVGSGDAHAANARRDHDDQPDEMVTAEPSATPRPGRLRWLPFEDPSRGRRLVKVLAWLAGTAAVVAVSGCSVSTWSAGSRVCGTPSRASGWRYLAAGWSLQTLQTMLTALGWYFILRAGYPDAPAPYRQVLAAYATGVALNGFLPANIGTFVMVLMFIAIIPGAGLPGSWAGCSCRRSSSRSPARSSTCTCSRPCRARSSVSSSCRTTTPV